MADELRVPALSSEAELARRVAEILTVWRGTGMVKRCEALARQVIGEVRAAPPPPSSEPGEVEMARQAVIDAAISERKARHKAEFALDDPAGTHGMRVEAYQAHGEAQGALSKALDRLTAAEAREGKRP